MLQNAVDDAISGYDSMRNSLCPIRPFVPFVIAMQSLLKFDKRGLRPGRGAAAMIGVTPHEAYVAAMPALLSGGGVSVSGQVNCGRIPLAVTICAMLMAHFTVISVLKKML